MTTTEIWDRLAKTDPKATKGFQRAGGFKGTAVNPTHRMKMMTQAFGPVGIGWGMTAPEYQIVTAPNGDMLVFCTAAVWIMHEGKKSELIYGTGGDVVASKRKSGDAFTDDEAFKKAFTDALGNAMKALGMNADVHLGLFDDAKYVNSLRDEFREPDARKVVDMPKREAPAAAPPVEPHTIALPADGHWRDWAKTYRAALINAPTAEAFEAWVRLNAVGMSKLESVSKPAHESLCGVIDRRRSQEMAGMEQPNTVMGAG